MVAATDETLVEINNLKMYFPVTQGIIFQKNCKAPCLNQK